MTTLGTDLTVCAAAAQAALACLTLTLTRKAAGDEVDPPRERDPFQRLPVGEAIAEELARWFAAQRDRIARAALEDPLPDPRDDDAAMARAMTPHLSAIWDTAGHAFHAEIGLDPASWRVTSPALAGVIERQALAFCAATNATSQLRAEQAREAVRAAIRAGVLEEGEATPKLAQRLQAIFDDKRRAERIADTEAKRAHNEATRVAGEASDVVVGWKWLLSTDACAQCQAVASKVNAVPKGQPFVTGASKHEAYATVYNPPLHPWCACTLTAVLDPELSDKPEPAYGQAITGEDLRQADAEEQQQKKKKAAAATGDGPGKPPSSKALRAINRAADILEAAKIPGLTIDRRGFASLLQSEGAKRVRDIVGAYDWQQHRIEINERSEYWQNPRKFMKRYGKGILFATNHPDHVLYHELGHAAFHHAVNDVAYNASNDRMWPLSDQQIAARVSRYARLSANEFIAEVYACQAVGEPRNDLDVVALYHRLGGPSL